MDTYAQSYDYFSRLSYAHAIVMETTRLYPAATSLPRRCWQDTVIPTDDGPLAVPRWAYAFIHVTGLHYNRALESGLLRR